MKEKQPAGNDEPGTQHSFGENEGTKASRLVLPGTIPIAVDQRDPDYPDVIRIDLGELSDEEPYAEKLLDDPKYVRTLRLELEHVFRTCVDDFHAEGGASGPPLGFDAWLSKILELKHEELEQQGLETDMVLKRIQAIQADYREHPEAGSAQLS